MKILFLCVENSARSQMAEALARSIAPAGVEVFSAGSAPAKSVKAEAIEVLKESGLDIADAKPKTIEELAGGFETVITLCADEVCPPVLLEKAQVLHWPIDDPGAKKGKKKDRLDAFRRAREELRIRLESFFEEEVPTQIGAPQRRA